jgi:hypothetical protein
MRIIHDWDFPINKPSTNLKISLWLFLEILFGKHHWFQHRLPSYIQNIKLSNALAMFELDNMFGVDAIWGLTDQVTTRYPTLLSLLERNNKRILHHYHDDKSTVGKGRWVPQLDVSQDNMIYDRRYCVQGIQTLPSKDESVVWHIDHPNNLCHYIEFLQRCKEEKLI